MKVFPWADYNWQKAAFKAHIGLDHDGLIPAFASITLGKESEMSLAKLWQYPKGIVLVFDKGYNSFEWHNTLSKKGVIWVTQIRANALYRVTKHQDTSTYEHITSNQIIEHTEAQAQQNDLKPIRRIGYRDSEIKKRYVFITNQF